MDQQLDAKSEIAQYRIVSRIGSGGMGEVYLAEDTRLDRQVALKVLHSEFAQDEDRVRRFIREAKAASALNHANILTVHEIGETDGRHYIATELIKGETLRDRLRRGRPPLRETLDIIMQTAAALNAAHDAGLVHRDIKPENIMIRDDGGVKILDFGLVKLSEKRTIASDPKEPTSIKTLPGMVMGTVRYMSPEQARGKETDARTDIWSLGVVLYEMLTGTSPFAGETDSDSVAAILTRDPGPLDSDIPHELQRYARRALEKDPGDRYQTVKDFLLDVRDLKREIEFSEDLVRSGRSSVQRSHGGTGKTTENQTEVLPGPASTQISLPNPSSAEYIITGIKQHKIVSLAVLGLLVFVAAGAGYWYLNGSSGSAINSVAVLPFENGTGDPDLAYLSDGLSVSLIDKLSRLPGLKVIARTSSFRFRGPDTDVTEVANKLGVAAIVTGSITKRGDQLIIRAELIDARENKQIWGEQYTRNASEALFLEREIAGSVSRNLHLKLSGAQEQEFAALETTSPEAYELFLRGQYFRAKAEKSSLEKSNQFFEQAVAADPRYAAAFAALSGNYSALAHNGWADPKEMLPKAETVVLKAIELEPNLPAAHAAYGGWLTNQWRWSEAEAEYRRAIDLDPNSGGARGGYAALLSNIGRHDEAVREAMIRRDLDPVSLVANRLLGMIYREARRYDEALAQLQRTLEMEPKASSTHSQIGYVYAGKGMYREAVDAYLRAIELGGSSTSDQIYLGAAYANLGERDKALAILKELQATKEYVSPGELPVLLAALGMKDEAFASFEKAIAEHDLQMRYLKTDQHFDPLRDDPRFAALLRRVGLPGS